MYKEKINSLGIQNKCPNEIKNKILKQNENVIFLQSKKNRLSSRQYIEKIAREKLNMYTPTPESLIVWINTNE